MAKINIQTAYTIALIPLLVGILIDFFSTYGFIVFITGTLFDGWPLWLKACAGLLVLAEVRVQLRKFGSNAVAIQKAAN